MVTNTTDILSLLETKKTGSANWGCGVIVHDTATDQILMGLRTDNNQWCSPGGKIETGETILNAVVRETYEEAGIRVKNLQFLGYREHQDIKGRTWVSFMFYCNQFEGTPAPQPSEMSEMRWIPVEEALTLDIFEPTQYNLALAMLSESMSPPEFYSELETSNGDGNGDTIEGIMKDSKGYVAVQSEFIQDLPKVGALYREIGHIDGSVPSYSDTDTSYGNWYTANGCTPDWD